VHWQDGGFSQDLGAELSDGLVADAAGVKRAGGEDVAAVAAHVQGEFAVSALDAGAVADAGAGVSVVEMPAAEALPFVGGEDLQGGGRQVVTGPVQGRLAVTVHDHDAGYCPGDDGPGVIALEPVADLQLGWAPVLELQPLDGGLLFAVPHRDEVEPEGGQGSRVRRGVFAELEVKHG